MNLLFCSAGRRAKLIQNAKKSIGKSGKVFATDNSIYAPAIYLADAYKIVPLINDSNYIDILLSYCLENQISAITTLIDPEIEILAKNRDIFIENGIVPLCPEYETAKLCFDKYKMFEYLKEKNIQTVLTFDSLSEFKESLNKKEIKFPVFVKPRTGSGSVGASKVTNLEMLEKIIEKGDFDYIIQEYMDCEDLDADVYVDSITMKPVQIFSKKKISTTIGGANKTISFIDAELNEFIKRILTNFKFHGPIDMDFFYKNGKYYLSEINPRFGGAYLHGYGCGVDFFKNIEINVLGKENEENFCNYDENVMMLMYDDVVIKKEND